LCVICGIGGYELRSSTDSASSPLPVSKGGTGGNNFPANSVLVGNGSLSFSSRGIDTTPQSGSNNLITSNGVYNRTDNLQDILITPRGSWVFVDNYSKKVGHTCSLVFRVSNQTASVGAGTGATIGDISSDCRPVQRIRIPIAVANTSQSFTNLYLVISDAGVLQIFNYGNVNIAAAQNFGIAVTYLVS
jgi:hypothetical protein